MRGIGIFIFLASSLAAAQITYSTATFGDTMMTSRERGFFAGLCG